MQRHIPRRKALNLVLVLVICALLTHLIRTESSGGFRYESEFRNAPIISKPDLTDGAFHWETLAFRYPLENLTELPKGRPRSMPRIQAAPLSESTMSTSIRLRRLAAVKQAFNHSWTGYRNNAWKSDEVGPLTGDCHDSFSGWSASLVDALDTLWIMGMWDEFEDAVQAIGSIDFTRSTSKGTSVFETTIRYLGGFLSAHDLSKGRYPILIQKAVELGEMLLHAFDTPNHMPIAQWDWSRAAAGEEQMAPVQVSSADIGSLTLEFTHLSQITGDMRFFDAVQRIMNEFSGQQMETRLPGMWPISVYPRKLDFTSDNTFTLGALSDSLYEYLPKEHILLGGLTDQYRNMYTQAAQAFTKHCFYRPMLPESPDVIFSGSVSVVNNNAIILDPSQQHLTCFVGGMVGIAAKIFSRPDDLITARQLVDGCIWAYDNLDNGLMAETSVHMPCERSEISEPPCEFDGAKWRSAVTDDVDGIKPGYIRIPDRRYILRPEAIESVFIWYRISGDQKYQDHAWRMFQAIEQHTRTDIAYAALDDVTSHPPPKADRMESFWMAETLKYFYLIFSDMDVVSLDEYVFNTEAHPFLRPKK